MQTPPRSLEEVNQRQVPHLRRNNIASILFATMIYACIILFNLPFFKFLALPMTQFYRQGSCTIIDLHIDEREYGEYTGYYAAISLMLKTSDEQIYTGRGYDWLDTESRSQESAQRVLDQYTQGQSSACWYNPLHPEWIMLRKDIDWSLVSLTSFWSGGIIASWLIVGGLFWVAVNIFSTRSMRARTSIYAGREVF